jgi:DNA-binding NarL/FixJ family response regulator
MRRFKVLVIDDHRLMLEAVAAALAGEHEFEIVGQATSADEALRLARQHMPDVALVDIRMPGVDGLECITQLRAIHPRIKLVVLSGVEDQTIVNRAFARGATAFVSKLIDPRDLAATLRQVVEGTVVAAAPLQPRSARESQLTDREREVLQHVASGAANREVGRQLALSDQTVKYHLSRIYAKLGVPGRVEAVRVALRDDLVELDADAPTLR